MRWFTPILALVVQSAISCRSQQSNPQPRSLVEERAEAAQRELVAMEKARNITSFPTVNINIYAHVLLESGSDLNVTVDEIKANITKLNEAYKPVNITFTLGQADWNLIPGWMRDWNDGKEFLHKGGKSALNIYYRSRIEVPGSRRTPHGRASFPWDLDQRQGYSSVDKDLYGLQLDGIDIKKRPGLQHSLIHEVGHWLGLQHTFEYLESGEGADLIDDTPVAPTPELRKSEAWPPHNYMAYSHEASNFTRGQVTRMRSMWTKYRANDTTATPPVHPGRLKRILPSQRVEGQAGQLAWYADPPDLSLVFQECNPRLDRRPQETRERFCGSRAYCKFQLYKINKDDSKSRQYKDETECLHYRHSNQGGLAKLPWLQATPESKEAFPAYFEEITEEFWGTSAFCSFLSERLAHNFTLGGKPVHDSWISESVCLDAHEAPIPEDES